MPVAALLIGFCFAFPLAVVLAYVLTSWWFWAIVAAGIILKVAIDGIDIVGDRRCSRTPPRGRPDRRRIEWMT